MLNALGVMLTSVDNARLRLNALVLQALLPPLPPSLPSPPPFPPCRCGCSPCSCPGLCSCHLQHPCETYDKMLGRIGRHYIYQASQALLRVAGDLDLLGSPVAVRSRSRAAQQLQLPPRAHNPPSAAPRPQPCARPCP